MPKFTFSVLNNLKALEKEQSFVADKKDLHALAQRSSVPQVRSFTIKAHGIPSSGAHPPSIVMHIDAALTLTCVHSKDPLHFAYTHSHTLILYSTPTCGDDDSEFVEHIHVEESSIDLKEIASQYIIMGIPDHPQKESLDEAQEEAAPKKDEHRPFSGLDKILSKKH